jgi:hypothetical protein
VKQQDLCFLFGNLHKRGISYLAKEEAEVHSRKRPNEGFSRQAAKPQRRKGGKTGGYFTRLLCALAPLREPLAPLSHTVMSSLHPARPAHFGIFHSGPNPLPRAFPRR